MCKYWQLNFFSNVVKYIRLIYGNKEELAVLRELIVFSSILDNWRIKQLNISRLYFQELSNN